MTGVRTLLHGGLLLTFLLVPALAPAQGDDLDVLRFVQGWKQSWEARDLTTYLQHYTDDARVGRRSRSEHETHKAAVFSRVGYVSVRVGDVSISRTGSGATVRFLQDYRSSELSDLGRKTLELVPGGPFGWSIRRETWAAGGGRIDEELGQLLARRESAVVPASPIASVPTTDPLSPLLGAEPGSELVPAETAAGTDDELLSLQPLTRDDLPASLRPLDVPGLPEATGERLLVEEIVARVNGRILTRSDFLQRLRAAHEALLSEDPPDISSRMNHLVHDSLESTIDRWLVLQLVRQEDVEAYWRERLAELRRRLGVTSLEEVEAVLEQQGLTMEMLREEFVAQGVIQQEIQSRLDTSEDGARRWFAENSGRYRQPARVRLRQILIPIGEGADAGAAEAVAADALERLQGGADFCEVHELYGTSSVPCGEIGEVALDDLSRSLRDAAAGLPVGAVSVPLRSSQGLHLLQVLERADSGQVDFDDVAQLVANDYLVAQQETRLDEFLGDLRRQAVVEINPRYQATVDASARSGQ